MSGFKKLAILSAFSFTLALFYFPYWEFIVAFIFLYTYLPFDRMKSLSVLNLFFMAVTGSAFAITANQLNADPIQWPPAREAQALGEFKVQMSNLLGLALFCGIYFLLFLLFKKKRFLRFPVLWGLAAFFLLWFLGNMTRGNIFVNMALYGCFMIVGKMIWMMCFQLSEVDLLKKRPFFEHLGTLNSPWQTGWTNCSFPRGYNEYLNTKVQKEKELLALQFQALKLLGAALLTKLIAHLFWEFTFSGDSSFFSTGWPNLKHFLAVPMTEENFFEAKMPWWQAWIYLLGSTFYFLLCLTAYSNAIVSIVRLCGFKIKRHVYRPYRSSSFNDFLNRIYYYYIAILQRFFFFPMWSYLSFIKIRWLRIFILCLWTIFVGGLINTIFRAAPDLIASDIWDLIDILIPRIPYFFLLGLCVGTSALMPDYLGKKGGAILLLKSTFYFVIYSLCFFTQMGRIYEKGPAYSNLFGF